MFASLNYLILNLSLKKYKNFLFIFVSQFDNLLSKDENSNSATQQQPPQQPQSNIPAPLNITNGNNSNSISEPSNLVNANDKTDTSVVIDEQIEQPTPRTKLQLAAQYGFNEDQIGGIL